MQDSAVCHKNVTFFDFLYKTQILEEAVLTSTHNLCFRAKIRNQSRTNGPINAHLTIAQVMPKYNHNNEKQEALL